MDMLYVCSCRKCAFLVHHTDVQSVKNLMQTHLEDSHGYDSAFVHGVPIEDFKEEFKIDRIKDDEVIRGLVTAFEHRGFWKALRTNPKNIKTPVISGLRSGEFKLFLKSEREQRLRMLEFTSEG